MIKKPEGLYKLESYRYFRAARTSPVWRRQQPIVYVMLYFFAALLVIYTFATSPCYVSMLMVIFSLITFASALIIGEYLRNAPSLATLMPLSERKKLIYRFTSSLYMLLRIILCIAVGFLTIIILGSIIFAISDAVKGGIASDSSDESNPLTVLMGTYGGIFAAAFVIICFSAGIISGYFKKSKNRNMFIFCFLIAVILSFIFTGLPYLLAHRHTMAATHAITTKIVSPFIEACYADMSVPWLCSLLWCLAAAGSLSAAIIIGIKKMKSSEY